MKVIAPPAISAAVALLLVATPAASAASDKPAASAAARHSEQAGPPGFATWAEVYALQDRLNATAQRILQAGDPGNPSIVADPLRRALLVYWKGDVPPAVRAEAAAAGVPVRFLPAAYTLRELTAEAQRLVGDGRVVEAAPKADA
uniref:hypothetical protein n=1 Tax=Allorhizocola rhizosphaerae TaxID=1872709 RepID=UPI001B8D32C1